MVIYKCNSRRKLLVAHKALWAINRMPNSVVKYYVYRRVTAGNSWSSSSRKFSTCFGQSACSSSAGVQYPVSSRKKNNKLFQHSAQNEEKIKVSNSQHHSHSQLCDHRVGAHLRLHGPEPAVSWHRHSSVMRTEATLLAHTAITFLAFRPVSNYTAWLQRNGGTCVNNLPRVVTWRCNGREFNLPPFNCKSDDMTITTPSHTPKCNIHNKQFSPDILSWHFPDLWPISWHFPDSRKIPTFIGFLDKWLRYV